EAKDANGADTLKTIPMLRHFHVFNIEQCDGVELDSVTLDELPEPERDAQCEAFVAGTGAIIHHGGSVACYRTGADDIRLPDRRAFVDAGAYYSTAFHELTHWTGPKSRYDRDLSGRFGADAYAAEELVAELGSAFLCQRFAVDGALQHPEYVGNWLKVLKGDTRAVFTASSKARKAAEYLQGLAASTTEVAA
ncbi:MAG: zincin-like metallopeptidase domain-containing protein, partial [Planctomycetota bacterium]